LHLDFNTSFAKHHDISKVAFCYGKIQWVDAYERKAFELLNVTLIANKTY
jgi:hypothetical protein